MSTAPSKGDVILINFNPQSGHEQAGRRPALVVSEGLFNRKSGFTVVCPITNQSKGRNFEVLVQGSRVTTGVILSDQFKSLDIFSRGFDIVDSVSSQTLDLVLSRISRVLGL